MSNSYDTYAACICARHACVAYLLRSRDTRYLMLSRLLSTHTWAASLLPSSRNPRWFRSQALTVSYCEAVTVLLNTFRC